MLMRQERGVCIELGEAHRVLDPPHYRSEKQRRTITAWPSFRCCVSGATRPAPSCSLDLLELDGTDLRREPIEARKATLAIILRKSGPGVQLNEHLEHPDGALVLAHAAGWEPR